MPNFKSRNHVNNNVVFLTDLAETSLGDGSHYRCDISFILLLLDLVVLKDIFRRSRSDNKIYERI